MKQGVSVKNYTVSLRYIQAFLLPQARYAFQALKKASKQETKTMRWDQGWVMAFPLVSLLFEGWNRTGHP